jgi:hypothetical protein
VTDAIFLGALYSADNYKVFGYCSNSLTKVILVCSPNVTEAGVRDVMLELYSIFVQHLQNPFTAIGYQITSKPFLARVRYIMEKHNTRILTNGARKA